jgi:hypothetical protein
MGARREEQATTAAVQSEGSKQQSRERWRWRGIGSSSRTSRLTNSRTAVACLGLAALSRAMIGRGVGARLGQTTHPRRAASVSKGSQRRHARRLHRSRGLPVPCPRRHAPTSLSPTSPGLQRCMQEVRRRAAAGKATAATGPSAIQACPRCSSPHRTAVQSRKRGPPGERVAFASNLSLRNWHSLQTTSQQVYQVTPSGPALPILSVQGLACRAASFSPRPVYISPVPHM